MLIFEIYISKISMWLPVSDLGLLHYWYYFPFISFVIKRYLVESCNIQFYELIYDYLLFDTLTVTVKLLAQI